MAAPIEAKVEFGLSNVHYALINPDGTYDNENIRAIEGGVSLSMDPSGDTSDFYADNIPYYTVNTNNGLTGTLEIARGNKQFLIDCLAMEEDSHGMLVDYSDVQPKEVALMFEVSTDEDPIKFVIFDVKFARSSRTANTKSESSDPDTQSFSYTAKPKKFTVGGIERLAVSGHMEKTSANEDLFNSFYQQVVTPDMPSA